MQVKIRWKSRRSTLDSGNPKAERAAQDRMQLHAEEKARRVAESTTCRVHGGRALVVRRGESLMLDGCCDRLLGDVQARLGSIR